MLSRAGIQWKSHWLLSVQTQTENSGGKLFPSSPGKMFSRNILLSITRDKLLDEMELCMTWQSNIWGPMSPKRPCQLEMPPQNLQFSPFARDVPQFLGPLLVELCIPVLASLEIGRHFSVVRHLFWILDIAQAVAQGVSLARWNFPSSFEDLWLVLANSAPIQ